MPDQNVTVTRRRLLGGVLTAGVASAAAGAGTMAYFSDTESSTGNTVTAGTLDLTLDGSSQTVRFLDTTGAKPGDSGQGSVTLGNAGTVAGDVEVEITAIRSTENGFYGAENGQDGSPNDGELDEHLEVEATLGSTTVWSQQRVVDLSTGTTYTPGVTLSGGGSADFTVSWVLPNDTPNVAQSDGVEIDLTFRLVGGGP